jgi:hypothetical protein
MPGRQGGEGGPPRRARRPWLVAAAATVPVCLLAFLALPAIASVWPGVFAAGWAVPAACFLASWLLVGAPILARLSPAPARDGLRAGLLAAFAIVALGFSYRRGSEQPLAIYVWAPFAFAFLTLAGGSVAGLLAQRLRRASPEGGRAAAVVAIAATPGFLATIALAGRWLDPSALHAPGVPWGEIAVAALLAGAGAAWLATSRGRRAAA